MIEGITFTGLKALTVAFDDQMAAGTPTCYNIFATPGRRQRSNVFGAVYIDGAPDSGGVNVHFQNNLVYGVSATSSRPVVNIASRDDGFIAMTSNTIAGTGSATSAAAAVNFYTPGSVGASFLENNIIYNGAGIAGFLVGRRGAVRHLQPARQHRFERHPRCRVAVDSNNNYGAPGFFNTSVHDYPPRQTRF